MFWPIGASGAKTRSPEASSEMPSSLAEQSIPDDSMPLTIATFIWKSPGRFAPGRAQGTRRPAVTFGAPHTICSGDDSPASTVHTLRRSASGCLATSKTCAITTLSKSGATFSSSSTSRPAIVRRCEKSLPCTEGLTKLRSQDSENFMDDPYHQKPSNELTQKAQVAVEEQPKVVHTVSEHGQAIRPHAEGKS